MQTISLEQLFDFDDDGDGDDRARLRRLVEDTRVFLDGLVKDGRDPNGSRLFYEDLREPMREAWVDVQPQFAIVNQHIQSASANTLRDHGLVGAQLKFKLKVISKRFRIFLERGGREILKWLLDAIDNALDSLLEAIGASGAIKEIKEGIKLAVLD